MSKKSLVILIFTIFAAFSMAHVMPAGADDPKAPEPSPTNEIFVITVKGIINPVSREFITNNIRLANEKNAQALIIELDTPGGLDPSMREIIKEMIASKAPIIVYVSPGGARAASAGAFITIAAHVAAMAPQTNIGAAHPVGVGGKMDKTMVEKVTNDAAAYIKSLAEKNGRNAVWAEDAVRKSISATEQEALKAKVIDLVADNIDDLLKKINGRKVTTASGQRTLKTSGVSLNRVEMGLRHQILDFISDPNVAYILMSLGMLGLFFEMSNPGSIFPGVLGGICLVLAFYAFQTLPVNYAGVLLIVLAVIMFILETQIVSHGVLAIGGVISMFFGSLMLFEAGGEAFKISLPLIIATVGLTAAFFIIVVGLVVRAHKRKPVTGTEGIVGMTGAANSDINISGGVVKVHGEIWSAYSDEPIAKGEPVIVQSIAGLKVKVSKK